MSARIIDGRQFVQQPDGTWAPSHHQQLLDKDAAERKARQVKHQKVQREIAQATASTTHTRSGGADFATGLALGALFF